MLLWYLMGIDLCTKLRMDLHFKNVNLKMNALYVNTYESTDVFIVTVVAVDD